MNRQQQIDNSMVYVMQELIIGPTTIDKVATKHNLILPIVSNCFRVLWDNKKITVHKESNYKSRMINKIHTYYKLN